MSKAYARLLASMARGLTAPLRRWDSIATRAQLAEQLVPVVPVATTHGTLHFYTPNKASTYWPRHALTVEPDTLAWIDGFAPGSLLWDIGASVGSYSLYAALRGHQVAAFEANPYTFHVLANNVRLNGMADRIRHYCAALAEGCELGQFFMQSHEAGTTGNAFGAADASATRESAGEVAVSMLAVSMDALVEQFGAAVPTHIKIDVDSIEDRIIAGGARLLSDTRVRSVLVEVDESTPRNKPRAEAILRAMAGHGFSLDPTHHSLSGNRLFLRG